MLRTRIRKILAHFFSNKFLNRIFPQSKSYGKIFWKIRNFLIDFPWWHKNIINWYDLFLIFLNIKKQKDIVFKNNYVFEKCNKKNWHILKRWVRLLENEIEFEFRGNSVFIRINNLELYFPRANNVCDVVVEIFINRDYDQFDYKDKSVIDIGGFVGESAIHFISQGAKKVEVYEINRNSFKFLKKNVKINNMEEKIYAYNIGIASEGKTHTYYVKDRPSASSLYFKEETVLELTESSHSVELKPFNEILKEQVDILKIDCEGCEYDILEDILKNNLVEYIREGIVMEGHNIDKMRNLDYLVTLLQKIGFKHITKKGRPFYARKV